MTIYLYTDNHWSDAHNRRKFFIEFATQKGFDPLVAINWENIQNTEIIKQVKRKVLEEGTEERGEERNKVLKFKKGRIWPTELL